MYLADGIVLAPRWADGMKTLGHAEFASNQWIWFNLLGLITGIAMIWIYAGIRPRFGAGPMTAALAGSGRMGCRFLGPQPQFHVGRRPLFRIIWRR